MNKRFNFRALSGVAGLGLVLASTASHAAIDVTAVTAEITATLAPIGLIGAGVLLVYVAIKAFKWVARAM